MINWYYKDGDKKLGPVDDEQIKEMAAQGKISSETMVWNELIGSWQSYGSVTGATAAAPSQSGRTYNPAQSSHDNAGFGQTADSYQSAPSSSTDSYPASKPEAYCSQCYKKFPSEDLIQYGDMKICAECKSLFFQKLREGSNVAGDLNYAGFWIRFVAKFIDGLIGWVASTLIMLSAGLSMWGTPEPSAIMSGSFWTRYIIAQLLGWAFAISYATFFVGKFGATPGKMALGLKIVTPEGGSVSYMRAFGRYFAEMISAMLLLIGYIMAAFDDEKRALHDRICGTRVIRK